MVKTTQLSLTLNLTLALLMTGAPHAYADGIDDAAGAIGLIGSILGKVAAKVAPKPKPQDDGTPTVIRPGTNSKATNVSLTSGAFVNEMLPNQKATMDKKLAETVTSAEIRKNREEAKGLIAELVSTSACASSDGAWMTFNTRSDSPKNWDQVLHYYAPLYKTTYHDKKYCLDVQNISNWSKPALNVLAFTVHLISSQSNEVEHQHFEIIKSVEGAWLVRNIECAGCSS